MLNTQADIDIFFETDDFAEKVSYTVYGGLAAKIKCIWDSPFQLTSAQGIQYQNANPNALFRTVDVPSASDKDTVIRSGVTYYVTEVQPDGTGVTRLILSEMAPQQ